MDVSPSGAPGNADGEAEAVTPDGRFVVFLSDATNLLRLPYYPRFVLYERDRVTGQTSVVSLSVSGQVQTAYYGASVSPDGRFVAFVTRDALDGPKPTGWRDVWVRDMRAGTVTRASVPSIGGWSHDNSEKPSISADGRYVSFESASNGMVPEARGHTWHVYLRDLRTGTTTPVDRRADGSLSTGSHSTTDALDTAGDRIVYTTASAGQESTGYGQVHLRQLPTGADRVVSGPTPGQPTGLSTLAQLDGTGRYVLFLSNQDLAGTSRRGIFNVFRKELRTGQTVRVNRVPAGGDLNCDYPPVVSFSADGRYGAYQCQTRVTGGGYDATVVIDLLTGAARRVDVNSAGQPGDRSSYPGGITDNGGTLLTSAATNLVAGRVDYGWKVLFAG